MTRKLFILIFLCNLTPNQYDVGHSSQMVTQGLIYEDSRQENFAYTLITIRHNKT